MAVNIQGGVSASLAEVETNTKSLRVTIRPIDYGSLGIYSVGLLSSTMAAALSAASSVWQARYTGSNLANVKKVLISAGNTSTAFTAGVCTFNLYAARSFSASGSGGTAATLTGNNGKLRTSMASTGMGDMRISSTAALTAGTWTLDSQPVCSLTLSEPATAGTPLTPTLIPLFEARAGDYPLVLANNEGLNIQATVPGTGTWQMAVTMIWEEIATSNWY